MSDIVENTLQHFGILGMKWGIRRFQNPDGSLTPEGKRRYYGEKKYSRDYVYSRRLKTKNYKNMTDKELKQLTNRLNMEKKLRELKASEVAKGAEYLKVIAGLGTTVASIYGLSQKFKKRERNPIEWLL
jgi:hypothetical protein